MNDAVYMTQAIELAAEALEDDEGGPFGAVVVKDGLVVGRGRNRVVGTKDPTAHAEMLAIRDACRRLGTHDLEGCTVYTSCEPCPMCLGALFWARVERIVYAVDREGAARAGFDDARFYEQMCRSRDERDVRMERHPDAEAQRVMEAWSRRPDRRDY